MISIAVTFSIALSCCASVDFTHSTLYDLYDFVGQEEVFIPRCDDGCLIFASTESPNIDEFYVENLIIHDGTANRNLSTVTDLSLQYFDTTFQKIPLVVSGPANISVLNLNIDDNYWPTKSIVIYVVEKPIEPNFSYNMYDARNLKQLSVAPTGPITVMSAYPFTLTAKASKTANGVSAWLTGLDNALNFNADECTEALVMLTTDPFPGFRINIAGPLISLAFNKRAEVQMSAVTEFSHTFDFAGGDGFVTSPGYNGCKKSLSGSVQAFRSDYLQQSDFYELSSKDKYRVSVNVESNLDGNHKFTITDFTNDRVETITGNKEVPLHFEPTYHLSVDFKDMKGDQGFLLRYSSEIATKATTMSTITSTKKATTTTRTPTTRSASLAPSTTRLIDTVTASSTLPAITATTTEKSTTSGCGDVKLALLRTFAVLIIARNC